MNTVITEIAVPLKIIIGTIVIYYIIALFTSKKAWIITILTLATVIFAVISYGIGNLILTPLL